MRLEDKLKSLRYKLDKIEVYKKIAGWNKFPFESAKLDSNAVKEVLAEVIAFAGSKIEELDCEEQSVSKPDNCITCQFEMEEVTCLKLLAKQLIDAATHKPVDALVNKPIKMVAKQVVATKQTKPEAAPKTESRFKVGDLAKLIYVSALDPAPPETAAICSMDVVKILAVDNGIATILHQNTGNRYKVLVDDLEAN